MTTRKENARFEAVASWPAGRVIIHMVALALTLHMPHSSLANEMRRNIKVDHTSAVPNIEWIRLHGAASNQHSVIGTQQESRMSYPGSRQGMTHWADHHGQLWMLGGWGFNGHSDNQPDFLNDLWTYNSERDKWKCLQNCGRLYAADNSPPARQLAAACGVRATGFVIFGGEGKDDNIFNDTWIYGINNATWLSIPETAEYPEGRTDAASWCVKDGLFILGGLNRQSNCLSDMWKFSFSSFTWQRLTQSAATKHSDYMYPVARHGASTWYVSQSKLYMFGGQTDKGYMSDLWMYDLVTNIWTLIHGDDEVNRAAQTGTLGINGVDVKPASCSHAATWVDFNKNLLMFGGESRQVLPDLWQFSTSKLQWAWLGRASLAGQKAERETLFPTPRSTSMSWSFRSMMFMFGGYGTDMHNTTALLNELYVLTKDNVTYFFSAGDRRTGTMQASTVFIIILSTFTGIALTLGAGFFLKKTLEYPRHSSGEFNVRYSPLAQETTLDM